jgi:uncharacterized phage protein (TIGR01671 family)
MQRKLKFRAWDEQKHIMHYDFEFIRSGIEDGNDWIIFKSDKQTLKDKLHPFENPYFVQQLKIMQCTGIKDNNGVEIYENDVVKYTTRDDHTEHGLNNGHAPMNGNGIVFWSDINAAFMIDESTHLVWADKGIKIIGNKYEGANKGL